jgi:hypothetical protein
MLSQAGAGLKRLIGLTQPACSAKSAAMTLALDLNFDPRWKRLHDPSFVCRACGQKHGGVFPVNMEKPFPWQGGEVQNAQSPDIDPRNYLLEDFCVIDNRQFFIRCVIVLPIIGGGGAELSFSTWVAVSSADFDRYGDSFDSPDQSSLGTFPGKLANRIGSFADTLDLPCAVRPQKGNDRPLLFIDAEDHPLAKVQKSGITFEQVLDFYAASGHDIRPGLKVVN